MVIRLGQRFKDVCQFRRALEVIAIREGFKICIVQNGSKFVICECAALCCDQKISVKSFQWQRFSGSTACATSYREEKSYRTSDEFREDCYYVPSCTEILTRYTTFIEERIAATYAMKCPPYVILEDEKRTKNLLRIDNADGYFYLLKYIQGMKHINRQNFVILKRDSEVDGDEDIFKRMFVLLHEPAYAFKCHLRRFLAIDTWEIKGHIEVL